MAKRQKAKIFRNGGSQAVRLPQTCRFPEGQREVLIKKVGRRVVLEPTDEWQAGFIACLGAWTDDIERPETALVADGRDPFE